MEICSGNKSVNHDEIVHDNKICPLCEALEEIENLKKEVERLNNLE